MTLIVHKQLFYDFFQPNDNYNLTCSMLTSTIKGHFAVSF